MKVSCKAVFLRLITCPRDSTATRVASNFLPLTHAKHNEWHQYKNNLQRALFHPECSTESNMAKSSIFEGFTSPAKGQPKKAVMKRYGRRQLLKEKAGKAFIQKNPNGAEIGEEAEAEEEEEEEMNEGEEADAEIRSTGTDANSEDVDNTSALQALADQFAVGAADDGSDIEETSEGSTMGQTTGDASLSGLVESSNDDEDTKKSESLTTPEEDMYYIEAVKSSRIGNGVRDLVLVISNK